MATTRATGYVVTASVWNAVLSRLTDDGVTFSGNFNGGSVAGTTGAFSSTLAVTGGSTFSGSVTCQASTGVPLVAFTNASALGLRVAGRSSDDIGSIQMSNNAGSTIYLTVLSGSSGPSYDTGSSSRLHSFLGGAVKSAAQPGFLAYNSASDTGVTSGSTVDFDTEVYDEASNFATDTFTAPIAGRYLFAVSVEITNASGGSANVNIDLVTSNRTYQLGLYPTLGNGDTIALAGSAIADMDASDTAYIVYEGSASMTIVGSAAARTFFCGRLLP